MKKLHIKYLTFVVLVFISCKKEIKLTEIQLKKTKQINLVESSKKDNIENYVNNIKVVELKTDIKLIDIDKVIFYNDNYFTLDKKTSNLLIFDSKGNFLRKIGERGNGPGEYKRIKDFEIDKINKHVLVLSEPNKAIYKFSLEGQFIDRIVLDFFTHGFVISNNGSYVFMSGRSSNTYHTLTRTDDKGKILNMEFPFPKNTPAKSPAYTGGLHKQGKTNYFTETTSSRIYEVQDSIIPLYQFNFGNDTWSEESRFNINQFLKKDRKFQISYLNNFYCDTDNVLAFQFTKDAYVRKGFYLKNTNKVLAVPYNMYDTFLYRFLYFPVGIEGDYFISSLDYSLYSGMMASQEAINFKESYPEYYNTLKHDLKDFTENDNPYLLIYEVKGDK